MAPVAPAIGSIQGQGGHDIARESAVILEGQSNICKDRYIIFTNISREAYSSHHLHARTELAQSQQVPDRKTTVAVAAEIERGSKDKVI